MLNLYVRLATLARRDSGQAISEYAILLAFIAVLSVGFIAIFGGKVADVWETISGTLP